MREGLDALVTVSSGLSSRARWKQFMARSLSCRTSHHQCPSHAHASACMSNHTMRSGSAAKVLHNFGVHQLSAEAN